MILYIDDAISFDFFSGYGRDYNTLHKDESGLNYLPDEIEDADFFN